MSKMFLRYGEKDYYADLVSPSDAKASDLIIRKGGTNYALQRVTTNGTQVGSLDLYDLCDNEWTVYGSPTISSDVSKFGKSLYLNGSSLIRTTNDYTLGDTDFTIDAWVNILQYCDRSDTGRAIFNFNSNTWHIAVFYGGQMSWQQNIGGAYIQTNAAVPKNEWHHIAVTHRKSANLTSLYLDGALQSTLNETITMLTGKLTVGLHAYQTRYFIGYLDEFRISNCARWTENFTPPTAQYTKDGNTLVLLRAK